MKFSYIMLFIISNNFYGQDPLSLLAEKHNTDKGFSKHNYTPIYNSYFAQLRYSPLKFLEIGFYHGASARMWQDYFPYAELHFMDIQKSMFDLYGQNLSSRCHLHVVDQSKAKELREFIHQVGKDFDIIIDDGGHTMQQQIISFIELFPYVKDGGMYIIEDLHTSYWKNYGGHGTAQEPKSGPSTMIQFLKDRIDDVNFFGAKTTSANKENCPTTILAQLNYYQKMIRSMHFYDSLCFIIKKEIKAQNE